MSPYEVAIKGNSHVLIAGPTGTGKSRMAEIIHRKSQRAGGVYVSVNLATLHEGTLESELFGHERGAFTGANQKKIGLLELANRGSVFLDEIGELPLNLQARLLEFLQSKTITPVGGHRPVKLDVRVIAATNRELSKMVKEGRFRGDLYHRLEVVRIDIKPLSRRRSENPQEFRDIVKDCLREFSPKKEMTSEVLALFEAYAWPGNIRDLRNVLEFATIASDDQYITKGDLPPWFVERLNAEEEPELLPSFGVMEVPLSLNYHETIEHFEKSYLKMALSRYRGRINLTSRKIGMNKTTFLRRLNIYGIHPNPPNDDASELGREDGLEPKFEGGHEINHIGRIAG